MGEPVTLTQQLHSRGVAATAATTQQLQVIIMSRNYQQPKPSMSILANVKRLYGNANLLADQLQFFVVALVREMEQSTKKDIMTEGGELNQTIEYIFANSPKGMDRGTMSAWFVKFTPIRPRFNKGNAHYEGFGWARKGSFDLDGAMSTPWHEADPESTREMKAPEVEKLVAALVTGAARNAAVSDATPEGIAMMLREAMERVEHDITKEMSSRKTQQWVERYVLSQDSAEQSVA